MLIHENVSADMLAGAYRAADLCLVSSLQDGMNLVAKEFIACQTEERGVLVLSRFTGASEEIDGAMLINPFNLDGFVEGIRRALHMSEGERRVRMHRMRAPAARAHDLRLARGDARARTGHHRGARAARAASHERALQRAFTPEIGERLSGTPLIVMLDVDGTLAPIAPRPEDATVAPATREVLRALIASKGVTVILVSGRSARTRTRLVGVDGVYTVGNHGFEVVTPDGELETDPDLADQSAAITQAARELEPIVAAVEGARLENKRWTLSVHYRLAARDAVPPLREAVERVALGLRLRMTEGKEIVEVRPVAHVDKGTAVVVLGERLGGFADGASIVFIGDDRTDEDAFRSLRARSARPVTIRVDETGENETAAEVIAAEPGGGARFSERARCRVARERRRARRLLLLLFPPASPLFSLRARRRARGLARLLRRGLHGLRGAASPAFFAGAGAAFFAAGARATCGRDACVTCGA